MDGDPVFSSLPQSWKDRFKHERIHGQRRFGKQRGGATEGYSDHADAFARCVGCYESHRSSSIAGFQFAIGDVFTITFAVGLEVEK